MTWDDDSDRICGARSCDGPDSGWAADARSYVAVRSGLARCNVAKCAPDVTLEVGAAHVQRRVESCRRRLDESSDLVRQRLELRIAGSEQRVWKPAAEVEQ